MWPLCRINVCAHSMTLPGLSLTSLRKDFEKHVRPVEGTACTRNSHALSGRDTSCAADRQKRREWGRRE